VLEKLENHRVFLMSGPVPTFFFHAGPWHEERFVSGKEMKDVNREYREKIRELMEPVLENEDMELVDVACLRMKTRWIVRIFMDKEGGVTLDDCADMSHQIGDLLDVHDLPPGPYTLEVSSPGLDRPLARDKDFMRFRGCHVCVKTDEKIDGIRNFQGILVDYLDENGKKILVVDVAGKTYRIPRDLVAKAHLEQEF
jgi:ribosome maturation factor RimP